MNNTEVLEVIRESFKTYLHVKSSRSNAKLKPLHGEISKDIQKRLGAGYTVKSLGYGVDKEGIIDGRYYPKNVDITVYYNGEPVAGYAVKFVMRNYSQNSNNYFENMLGETANIRTSGIPYFQIVIIFDKVPYHKTGGVFDDYDILSEHNIEKYLKLSEDNTDLFYHTPDKTLLMVLTLKEKTPNHIFNDENDYNNYYNSVIDDSDLLSYSKKIKDSFGNAVVLNDYDNFIDRSVYAIKAKLK